MFLLQEAAEANGKYSAKQIEQMLYVQGGSIIEVKGDKKGGWKMVTDSKYARRVTGLTDFALTGPGKGSKAMANATNVKVHLQTVLVV